MLEPEGSSKSLTHTASFVLSIAIFAGLSIQFILIDQYIHFETDEESPLLVTDILTLLGFWLGNAFYTVCAIGLLLYKSWSISLTSFFSLFNIGISVFSYVIDPPDYSSPIYELEMIDYGVSIVVPFVVFFYIRKRNILAISPPNRYIRWGFLYGVLFYILGGILKHQTSGYFFACNMVTAFIILGIIILWKRRQKEL